jgi:GAF domain-containing protein
LAVLGIRNDISQQKRAEQVAQRRADQLLAASEIARETSQALQLSELLDRAANSIQERFDFYHTAIFLIDRANENAVLMEATGITGEKMKASGHKVPIGSQSLVGQSAYHKMPIVANDVTVEENFSPNTFLPGTLAELSIPMSVGEQIVGVLDVHSSRKNAFMDEDVDILQILTDHLAIAVLNANLFAQSTSNLNLHRIINQTTSEASLSIVISDAIAVAVRNLSGYKPGVRVSTYLIGNDGDLQLSAYAGYGEDQPASTVSANDPLMGACLVNNEPVLVNDTQALDEEANINRSIGRSVIMVPITYASQAIGVVLLEMLEPHGFDQNELEIISALSRNLGSIVNNIRLLVDNRRQIERERQLYEITSRIRRSTDFETILNTSVKEISKVINASRARISLSTTDDESNEELINKQLEEQQPNKNGNNGHGGEELL